MIPGVRKGSFRAAHEAVVAHLRAHPLLSGRIRTWYCWDGPKGVPPEKGPALADCPALQVRNFGGPSDRFAGARTRGGPGETVSRYQVELVLDLCVPTPDQGDVLDLGELIYDALLPQDRAERAATEAKFFAAGIVDHRFERPIAPMSSEAFAAGSVSGRGSLVLTLQVPS